MRVPWALLVALLWLAVAVWWAVPGLAGPDKRLPLLSAPPSLSPDGVTPRSHSPGPGTERGRDGGPLRAPRAGTEPRRPADGAGPTAAERAAGGAGASAGADRAASRRTRAGGDTRDTGRGGGGGGADPRAAAEGPAARRSHAPGRRPDPPNGDRGPAVAGRPAAGGRPPPATARYVRICSVYGDLSNQILAVVKAYAVADVLNRTLVLPLIRQHDFFALFDEATLRRGPVPVVPVTEYKASGLRPADEGCLLPTHSLHCSCRRPAPAAQRPAHRTLLLNAKDLFNDVHDLRLHDPAGPPRFGLSFRRARCMFPWLAPERGIAAEAARFAAAALPTEFFAVHLRPFHFGQVSHCRREGLYWARVLRAATGHAPEWERWAPTGHECAMAPAYVAALRRNASGPFFLASDMHSRSRVRALEALGGVRYAPGPGGAFNATPVRLAVLDQFLLAAAGAYAGNPFSSFSSLVCDLRRSRGRGCLNMPPVYKPCISYPDHFVTPRLLYAKAKQSAGAGSPAD